MCLGGRSDVSFYFVFSFSKLAIIFFYTTCVIEKKKKSVQKAYLIFFLPKNPTSLQFPHGSEWPCVFSVLQVICSGILNFLILFPFTSHTPTILKCNRLYPSAQISATTARVHLIAPPIPCVVPFLINLLLLPIIYQFQIRTPELILLSLFSVKLVTLYYRYPHLKFCFDKTTPSSSTSMFYTH